MIKRNPPKKLSSGKIQARKKLSRAREGINRKPVNFQDFMQAGYYKKIALAEKRAEKLVAKGKPVEAFSLMISLAIRMRSHNYFLGEAKYLEKAANSIASKNHYEAGKTYQQAARTWLSSSHPLRTREAVRLFDKANGEFNKLRKK